MKRFFTILTLLCLLQLSAEAQWYLFPGKKKRVETEKKEEAPKPVQPADSAVSPADSSAAEAAEELWFFDTPSVINVCLILPLKAGSDTPSGNFLEMYGGALLALRDIGDTGVQVSLRVVDSTGEDISESVLAESDVVIGPVGYEDIVSTLPLCGRKMLVSPLEPRTAALAGQGDNVIQAPVPWTRQIDEMLDWLREDMNFGDEIIVLRENSPTQTGEQSSYLLSKLQEKGLRYKPMQSPDELRGEDGEFIGPMGGGKYRILIASDSDSFIASSVRSTGIAAALNGNIVLYSTSRVRNCVGPDVLDLYNANTRLTAAYHIDYDSPSVKAFVLSYRALYGSEPGSFAFQGYDTMHYFVKMCAEYGRRWDRRLPERSERGLQSDFRFEKSESRGRVNQAVRRIIYNKDLSTSLL